MLEPYLRTCDCGPGSRRKPGVHTSTARCCIAVAMALDAAGIRPAPARDRRRRRPHGAGCHRGGAHGQRRPPAAAPPGAPAGHPPRRHAPLRSPGTEHQRPGALGLQRRTDGRADQPDPRRRTHRLAVSLPFPDRLPGRTWSWDRTGRFPHPTRSKPSTSRSTAPTPPTPDAQPLVPGQAITLLEAMRGYTAGSAWINRDHEGGSIRPGARADLVLLDADPFAISSARLARRGGGTHPRRRGMRSSPGPRHRV